MAEPVRKTIDMLREATQCPTCGQRFGRDALFCPFDGLKLGPASYDPLGDPLLGTTIEGRYEVLELLGEGGTGRVYKVRHATLGRLFAMKVLRPDLARDEVIAARFIQEARATARVRHPHIVEIMDYGSLREEIPFFVTELLLGQTLRDVVRRGPLPLPRAIEVVKQVASAVDAAHGAGIVHRDLKPDNIFLVDGHDLPTDVRVVDFGAAKVVGASRLTRDGIVYGTPHYMSPEQASGQPVDHRSDIYSLGIIMYELFTGRVPFEADTYMGVLTQHMFVQPIPPGRVIGGSAELGAFEDITLVCLSKRPEDRYSSMRALSAEIERAWSGIGPVPASHTHRVGRASVPSSQSDAVPTDLDARKGIDSGVLSAGLVEFEQVFQRSKRRMVRKWLVFGGVVVAALGCAGLFLVAVGAGTGLTAESRNPSSKIDSVPLAASSAPVRDVPAMPATVEAQTMPSTPPLPPPLPSPTLPLPTTGAVSTGRATPSGSSRQPTPRRLAQPRELGKIDDIGDPFAVRR